MANEKTSIKLDIYPEWTGARVIRDFAIQRPAVKEEKDADGKVTQQAKEAIKTDYKFEAGIPVPTTDEESQALFSVPLKTILELGAKQHSYNCDTALRNKLYEALDNGVDFGSIEDVSAYTAEFQTSMSTPTERKTSASAENKRKANELDQLKAQLGLDASATTADIIAMAKQIKAKK